VPFFIDTNIAIHAGSGNRAVRTQFEEHAGAIVMSVLTLVELKRGLVKVPEYASIRRLQLEILLKNIPVLPFDKAAAESYSRIIAQLGWVRGRDFDRMIAAHAIAADCTLVTANGADFRDIPGLKIENWAQ
jgi:tRNA(fMet)-specific endonuclease VapC